MSGWIRDPNRKYLNRVENNPKSEPEIEDNKMGEVITLHDFFYPPRTTTPSCFNISVLKNIILELKLQYTHMLPKFTGVEDAYLFLREFEEVFP